MEPVSIESDAMAPAAADGLNRLLDSPLAFLQLRDPGDTIAAVCADAARVFRASLAHVALADPAGERFTIEASFGVRDARWSGTSLVLGEGLCGLAAQEKNICARDRQSTLGEEPDLVIELERLEGIESTICAPLESGPTLLGVLWLCHKTPTRYVDSTLRLARSFARLAATAIENSRVHEKLNREAKAAHQLFALLRSTSSHSSLAMAVCEMACNPVALYDQKLDPLACYPPSFITLVQREADSLKSEINQGGHPEYTSLFARLEEHQHGLVVPAGEIRGWPFDRALAAAVLGDEVLGSVEIIGVHRRLTQEDAALAERAGKVLALQLTIENVAADVERRLRGELIDDLLSDKMEARESAVRRATHLGHDLGGPHWAMVVEIPELPSLAQSRGWNARHVMRVKRELLNSTLETCSQMGLSALARTREGQVLTIVRRPVRGDLVDVSVSELGSAILTRLRARNRALPLRLAIGGRVDDVRDIRRSHEEAVTCLRVGQSSCADQDVIVYEELGVLSLLCGGADDGRVDEFTSLHLGVLFDYDAKHHSHLIDTLAAYLNHYCNKTEAASSIHVHINTLKYRLNQIGEITQLDLNNPASLFDVHLALKIHSTRRLLG